MNTKVNPADAPSRGKPVPPASREPSIWWPAASSGDFGPNGFSLGFSRHQPASALELLPDIVPDIRSGRDKVAKNGIPLDQAGSLPFWGTASRDP